MASVGNAFIAWATLHPETRGIVPTDGGASCMRLALRWTVTQNTSVRKAKTEKIMHESGAQTKYSYALTA